MLAFLLPASAAGAATAELRVERLGVTAVLRGDALEHDREAGVLRRVRDLTVSVEGAGASITTTLPTCAVDCGERERFTSATLAVRDLDGDGVGEVLVDRFVDGSVCCSDSTTVLDLFGGRWEALRPVVLGSFYTVRDLDSDGVPELVGDDQRFFTRFAPRVFGVFLPLRVHRYRSDGTFVDVTMALRPQLRDQRAEYLRELRAAPKVATRAILPAIVALDHLLGSHALGEHRLRANVRAHRIGPRLARAMRRFLKRAGYCAGCPAPAVVHARLPSNGSTDGRR